MSRSRILSRYLFRAGLSSWAGVTVILLAIMLATRLARFLGEAAKGNIDPSLLAILVGLSSVQYLTILIPVSLLIGVMLTLGRLYSESEIDAMHAGGLGLGGLYRPFVLLGLVLAGVGAILSLWLSPLAGRTADFMVKQAGSSMAYAVFEPGRFQTLPDDRGVLYVQDFRAGDGRLNQVFAEVVTPRERSIILAEQGQFTIDASNQHRLVLREGTRRDQAVVDRSVQWAQFGEHGLTVTPPVFRYTPSKTALKPTADLLGAGVREDQAEWHWRLATPISTLLMVLIAVPLARTTARKGRYGRLGWGIVAFLIYFNLLGLGQAWLESGQLPMMLGLWWVHILVLSIALGLWLRAGRYRQRYQQGLLWEQGVNR
ncbi:MAG: LPS export ABC transporter permease LptF [Oceanococcaceae bacterium]